MWFCQKVDLNDEGGAYICCGPNDEKTAENYKLISDVRDFESEILVQSDKVKVNEVICINAQSGVIKNHTDAIYK